MNTFATARKLFIGALCTAASALSASATTINTVKLVDAGSPANIASTVKINGETINNVYIGPYTISVNGVNMAAMCIDFAISSTVGDTYTAYSTNAGASNLSNTYAPTEGQEYKEEAYLFSQINQAGLSNATRTAIQEAAWDIMSYGITSSAYKTTLNNGSTNTNTSSVEAYIDAALANYSTFNTAAYFVISDTTKGGEQEFIVDPPAASSVTPEPSSLMLVLAPALAGAAALRRRKLNPSLLG